MQVAGAIARVLKAEGVKFIIGYPVNPIIEAAAEADIRTIIVRQERVGLHMADAVSRLSSGDTIGDLLNQLVLEVAFQINEVSALRVSFLPCGREPGCSFLRRRASRCRYLPRCGKHVLRN